MIRKEKPSGNGITSLSKHIKVSMRDRIKPEEQVIAYVAWARAHGLRRVSVYNAGTSKIADACTGTLCGLYLDADGEIDMLSDEDSER